MDTSKLEQDLKDALTQVVSDEATLQAALSAISGVLAPPETPEDAAWVAVKAALEANGWSAPA